MNLKRLRFDKQIYQFHDDLFFQIQIINVPETTTILNSITVSE